MIEVKVAENGMTAEVFICPEPDEKLTEKLVEDTLRLEGVQAGIDKEAIADMLEKKIYNQYKTVANGKNPVNGLDGYYEFFFSTDDDGKPKIREDGSVDYNYKIINVNEGDVLAEYHPETGGAFGYNVFSKMLPPIRGKAMRPLRCFNVRKEDNIYYADKNGHVSLSGSTLSIHNVLEITGDTTYDNGDIDFNGDVHVIGNVCNGITVRAAGSVIVDGVIENASVYAGLDVVVGQGIHGQGINKPGRYLKENDEQTEEATVEAKGQLKSKFIEHAFVRADGDIFMDYAVGSVLISKGKVNASGAKGAIIGGSVTALLGIDAGTIGNYAELPTEIKVGEKNTAVIVRKALYPNVRMYFGKLAAPEFSGIYNVEFRNIDERILCKTIGTYKESELAYGLAEKEDMDKKRQTILVIDDDSRFLRTVNGMLEKEYQVAIATSGKLGRKYLDNHLADLILLDYMMPEENGVEVLKSLRANEDTKDIPVVFLTGLDDKKKILECLSLKPAGYLMKPVERGKLLTKIGAVLGGLIQ